MNTEREEVGLKSNARALLIVLVSLIVIIFIATGTVGDISDSSLKATEDAGDLTATFGAGEYHKQLTAISEATLTAAPPR